MKIVWIPLPWEHRPGGRLALSIFVSPRLDTTGVLGDVDRMVEWPEFVNSLDMSLVFNGTDKVTTDRKPIEPEWWKKLFTADTPLQAHTLPDYSKTLIHTFPVQNVLSFIESTYKQVAETARTELPTISGLQGLLGPLRGANELRELNEIYESALNSNEEQGVVRALPPGASIAGLNAVASDFFRAHRFYRRLEQESSRDHDVAPDRPEVIKPDFHRMLAFLADSPELMRRVGLIVDLEFDDPGSLPPSGTVALQLDAADPGVDITPETHYQLTADHFLTAPKGFLIEQGTLHLDWVEEIFDFYQVDLDGAALKLLDFSSSLPNIGALPDLATPTPGQTTLPSLRSAGFTISARARAIDLVNALDGSTSVNTDIENNSAKLNLEDVLRGYRLDAQDVESGRWFSLLSREGVHNFLGSSASGPEKLGPIVDEGYVRANSATSSRVDQTDPADPNKPGKDDLYLHEAMFGWDGWSLAAPRPGKVIVEPGEGEDGSSVAAEQVKAGTEMPLESVYRPAPESLPRLRYGRKYRIRARTVDLAGNGIRFTPDDLDDRATPERSYLRYEPVSSPTVVRRHPDTEGESLERMVIRSDVDMTPAEYVALPEVVAASAGLYAEDSQRHIAPPKTAVQFAELHGRLDGAFGPAGDPQSAFRIAAKEEGTFLDAKVVNPVTGNKDIDVTADIKFYPEGQGPADPNDLERGQGLPQGVYMYRPGQDLKLPYLPDPIAVGVGFYDLPGHSGSSFPVPFVVGPDGWWDLQTFRVKLVGVKKDAGPLKSELVNSELVVTLPQAERVIAKVSCMVDADGRETLGIWNLMSEPAHTDVADEILAGRMWMMTPFRYLEFVHAVQHPLADPIVAFTPIRKLGQTFSGFTGTIGNHAKSTGRLDVLARWSEPLDSGAKDDPPVDGKDGRAAPKEKRAVAFGWDIAESEDAAKVDLGSRVSRHEFGDTRHRKVNYRALATTRFREYFPPEILENKANIQRLGPEVELVVPNSARPAPPKMLYAIPTFRWEEKKTRNGKSRTRRGGGLRVYLDRPWYSSGEGELLGVVAMPPPKKVPPDLVISGEAVAVERLGGIYRERSLTHSEINIISEFDSILAFPTPAVSARTHVTTIGKDPTWASRDPKQTVSYTDFPLRTKASRTGLSMAEIPGARVAVAAHEVHYDPERELWYSDIELSPGLAYFPFVRLALARFQPESIDGAHLSPIVLTDFIQLTADRKATVSMSGSEARVSVSGIGPHNIVAERVFPFFGLGFEPSSPKLGHSRRVAVQVQTRESGVQSDLAWSDQGDEVFLPLVTSRGPGNTWRGKVPLPDAVAGDRRLLIREYEYFFTDWEPDTHGEAVSNIIPGQPVGFVRSRVVYVDTFTV